MSRKIQLVYLILLFITCSFTSVNAQQTRTHKVEQGQTAYSIANFYNISVEQLKEYNPTLDESFSLKLGQELTIPVLDSKEEVFVTKNIIHKVQANETLYSIATKYDVSVDEVKRLNKLNGNNISIDQELIIGQKKVEVQPEVVSKRIIRATAKTHLVQEKETVYSLSKQYEIDADSIAKWNNLEANNIRPGQNLIIGWEERTVEMSTPTPTPHTPIEEAAQPESRPVVISNSGNSSQQNKQTVLQERYAQQNNAKQTEGAGIWFETENTMMNSTFYALFNDTKVGSVVQVTNLMNNHAVYVKVIGSLPDTAENAGATIKLTPACKAVLQNNDGKFRVRVTHP